MSLCLWILTSDGRAMEMEVTMVGLQNAGKTSLLRVLAVGFPFCDMLLLGARLTELLG